MRKENKSKTTMPTMHEEPSPMTEASPMTDYEMSERLNQILSGGKLTTMKLSVIVRENRTKRSRGPKDRGQPSTFNFSHYKSYPK